MVPAAAVITGRSRLSRLLAISLQLVEMDCTPPFHCNLHWRRMPLSPLLLWRTFQWSPGRRYANKGCSRKQDVPPSSLEAFDKIKLQAPSLGLFTYGDPF